MSKQNQTSPKKEAKPIRLSRLKRKETLTFFLRAYSCFLVESRLGILGEKLWLVWNGLHSVQGAFFL